MTDRDGFEEITFSTCPECSGEAYYDSCYDFYACPFCGETWSYGINDLDDNLVKSEDEFFDKELLRDMCLDYEGTTEAEPINT